MTNKKVPLHASSLRKVVASAAAVAALLAGCASPPTRYYTLAAPSVVSAVPVATTPAAAGTPQWIELAPLAMPERLARPQLVVRGGAARAEVEILEQHRWASSFESELRDALASGIASRLGALDGTKGGRPASAPVTRIAVQLRQFDAVEGEHVEADFGWTLRRAEPTRALVCQMKLREPVVGREIDSVAQAAQRVTARAAEAIARGVTAIQQNPDAPCPVPDNGAA